MFREQQVSHIDFVSLLLGLLFWWRWSVSVMAAEQWKISQRKDDKGKVMVNKRLLIQILCVTSSGNIKVIPLLLRSDQAIFLVCPLHTLYVMHTYPNRRSLKTASLNFIAILSVYLYETHCVEINHWMQLFSVQSALWFADETNISFKFICNN